jgi:F-type H+-transporting ATPase subunit alpha
VPVEEQVLVLLAVTEGHLDDVAVGDVRRFESELREFFKDRYSNVLAGIRETGKLPEGDALVAGISAFKESFAGSQG